MIYTGRYDSPLGRIVLAGSDEALIGLWFEGQAHFGARLPESAAENEAAFTGVRRWLDDYFSGKKPPVTLPLQPIGTVFQRRVWKLLLEIPYGETTSYGALAGKLQARYGTRTSARAVGGAVGRNPISLLIPCHRVLGADGSLTGYAGGLERKRFLLRLEGVEV